MPWRSETYLKQHSSDCEQAEHDDLQHQSNHNHCLPVFDEGRLEHEARRAALNPKREDVSTDKRFCKTTGPYYRVPFSLHGTDDATESHVDGSCEKSGRNEDEEVLDDVGHKFSRLVVCVDSSTVADDFDWRGLILAGCP